MIHLILAFLLSSTALATPDADIGVDADADADADAIDVPPLSSGARGLGLGISIGEPTGIAGAARSSSKSTFAGVVGWSLNTRHIHAHVDYLFTLGRLQPDPAVELELNFFLGAGGSIDLGTHVNKSPALGIRIPAGVALNFGDRPVDVFVELVPVMGLVPDTLVYFHGALGVRIWFDPS